MENIFKFLKDFINYKEIGEIVTRKDMLKCCFKNALYSNIRCSHSTVDAYRNWLEKTYYLSKTNKRGEFIVMKHIEKDLNTSELLKKYSNVLDIRRTFLKR